jgi:hypothetical protein
MEYNYYHIIFTTCTTKDLLGNLLYLFASRFEGDKQLLGKKILNLLYLKFDITEEIKELYFGLVEELFEIMPVEDKLLVSFHLLTAFPPNVYNDDLKLMINKHLKLIMENVNTLNDPKFPVNEVPAAILYQCCLQVANSFLTGNKSLTVLPKDGFLVQSVGALFLNGQIKGFPIDFFRNNPREEDWIAYLLLLIEVSRTLEETQDCNKLIFTACKHYIRKYKVTSQIIELAISVIKEKQRNIIRKLMNSFNISKDNLNSKEILKSIQESKVKDVDEKLIKEDVNSSDEDIRTIVAELTQRDELQDSLLDFSLSSNTDMLCKNIPVDTSLKSSLINKQHIVEKEFTPKTLIVHKESQFSSYNKVMECRAGIIRVPEYLDKEFITQNFPSFIRQYIEIQDRQIANNYEAFHKHFKNQ